MSIKFAGRRLMARGRGRAAATSLMSRTARLALVCCIALLAGLLVIGPTAAAPRSGKAGKGITRVPRQGDPSELTATNHVPGEVLVRYRPGTSGAEQRDAVDSVEGKVLEELPIPRVEHLALGAGVSVKEAVATLEDDPNVAYAEPNFIYYAQDIPTDTLFPNLWGLHNTGQTVNGTAGTPDADIDAVEAWDTTGGSSDVIVAVTDTGVADQHPDLQGRMWSNPGETGGGKETNSIDDDGNGFVDDFKGWDWIADDNDPEDLQLHGTHVAGTIGASRNGTGVVGVAYDTTIMPLRILNAGGSGSNADIAAAFTYAGANGADIVNASLGGGGFSSTMEAAINGAPNTLFVVAAGNSNVNNDVTPSYPCNYTSANLICVAATDQNDGRASFSNYGATSVDVGAPGTNILSTFPSFDNLQLSDFEGGGLPGWTTGGTNNTWGPESFTAANRANSVYASDSPSGNYLPSTNSWVQRSAAFDLTESSEDCAIRYLMNLETESGFDRLWLDASSNGTNWFGLVGWSGSTGSFTDEFATDLVFGASGPYFEDLNSVEFRFRLQTDNNVQFNGARLDDVALRCPGAFSGDEFAYLQGTSMATPHVAGVAALVKAVAPSISVADLKDAILTTGDPVASLNGITTTGRRVNAAAAVASVAPEPETAPPADFDGDGDTDKAVYRPSNGSWYIRGGSPSIVGWGNSTDIPVPADYDGDGDTDIAVFRPSQNNWYIRNGGTTSWGVSGDIPVPGDYDGDGDADIAVYRPSNGNWYVRNGSPAVTSWGVSGDIPVPGDYDGDGDTDKATFRPTNGSWYVKNGSPVVTGWGVSGDIPVVLPYAVRRVFF